MGERTEERRDAAPATQRQSMRVLFVTPRYFPFMGGIETHVHEVAQRLAAAGMDVTVLTTDPSGKLPAREEVAQVTIRRVRAWPANKDYYFAPDVARIIAREPWDLIHCQGIHTLVPPLAMRAAIRAKIPFVLTFHTGGHSSRMRNAVRSLQWMTLRPLLARARALIGVSTFEADFFRRTLRLPADRFVVIRNGGQLPSLDDTRDTRDTRAASDDAPAVSAATASQPRPFPLIISIGRLERYKGHHRVLAALPYVRRDYPDARLLILGSGPYEATLRRLAARLGVADATEIRMIHPTDRAGMASTLAAADVVALLSEYEAHPVAVMEALTAHRPVLVAYTSGLQELADAGLARAIPLRSAPTDAARAIVAQLRDPLIPSDLAVPTWQDCADALLAVYERVVGETAHASNSPKGN
ncbi:MAG TPA: glycosyltransferase family 4 protein [Ktedonobacterales bacterium]|nr:glycosyltransferase family 4 protein [Ktedonobacterales bacterium]